MGKKNSKSESRFDDLIVEAAFVLGNKVGPNESLSINIKKTKRGTDYQPFVFEYKEACLLVMLREAKSRNQSAVRKISSDVVLSISITPNQRRS